MVEWENQQSWEEAKQITSLICGVPSSFSACVRFLRHDAESGNQLSPNSRSCLRRLIKSPSFAAPIYYCAKAFRPHLLPKVQQINSNFLANIFKPDEISVIISLLYLFRRIRKGCDPEQWSQVEKSISTQTDIGGFVGDAIPAIGFSNGLLAGCMRPLSMSMFLCIDKKNYGNYRRALKREQIPFDLSQEYKIWNCTHVQIASILTQLPGLGNEIGNAVVRGLSEDLGTSNAQPKAAPAIHAASTWISSLYLNEKQPSVVHGAQFFPKTEDLELLLKKIEGFSSEGTTWDWLNKGKADLSPEKAPELFGQAEIVDDEMPNQLAGIPDDFKELEQQTAL